MKTSLIHVIPTSELKKRFPNYTSITRALCRKRDSDHVIIVSQKDQQKLELATCTNRLNT